MMSKCTNLDLKDAACLCIVRNLQHPTCRPTTYSMQLMMVNPLKKNFSRLPASRHCKSTKQSTQQCHQANEGQSGLEGERALALGALGPLRSKKKLAGEKCPEIQILSNEEKEKWIEDYIERETTGARNRVKDSEAAVLQDLDDITHDEFTGLTSRETEMTIEEMVVAIGNSLSDLPSSDDGEDVEDEDGHVTQQGKLSEDDEPGWVMGTMI